MTTKDLKKIKEKLPKKWRTIISAKTGFTSAYINLVMNGQRDHESDGAKLILKTAAKIAAQNKNQNTSDDTELKNLVSQL